MAAEAGFSAPIATLTVRIWASDSQKLDVETRREVAGHPTYLSQNTVHKDQLLTRLETPVLNALRKLCQSL